MALNIQIIIDVTSESPGAPGVARTFPYSKLASVPTVALKLQDVTGVSSFHWEFVDKPTGSSASLSSSSVAEPTFVPDVDGTYLVQCTVNDGEAWDRNAVAFTTQNRALRKPAGGETNEFDQVSGWKAAVEELYDSIDGGSTDSDAIHDNVAGEIAAVAAKAVPVAADLILIEDSADGNAKKSIELGDIPVTDADAIHDNVAGEIAAIASKAVPTVGDILLIEDVSAANVKKRVTIGSLPGGGGGGNDSYPDIDQWVTVDKTTGSYTEDGTIQFPEDTIADAITAAAAMTPTATKRVAIKLMPGHYTEDSLDLPSYVYVVGESREACVITQTGDTEIIEQTNDHAGYYNVSIERLGSSGGTTGNTGSMTITVDTPTFEQDTLDDAGGSFTSDLVGQPITISGSSVSGNNGTFQVLAVNSSTQLVYKNSDFTKGNVTETLTYSFPTFTSAIDIDGVEDFHFRDVAFDFDERPGILVQGSSDSDVTFARCFMTQTFVTSPYDGKLWRYGLTVSGSGDHQVLLDDVDAEGLGAECSAGTLKVVDTRLHHLAMGEDASLFMYQCEVECPDLPGPYLGGGYMPVDVYEDALRLDTTGQVRVERSTILGWASMEFGMQGPEWKYCLPVRFDSQPSRSYFSSCHFGNHMPGRTPPTSPYQELPNSIVGTADSIFRNCAFDYPVEDTIIDTTTSLKLVGPGEMYDSVRDAMLAAAAQAQDDIVIKLMADKATAGDSFSDKWPDGYRTVLDLNGFQLEDYTLVGITSGMDTYQPLATIKNGRLKNCSPLVVSNTSNTADWKVALRNIDMDPTEEVNAYIRSGGSGAELILDNVRDWVGQGTYALWIDHVNPTVTFRNGSYIKGSVGNPAVRFTVACTKFRAARSTFLHGSSGSNNPFSDTTSGITPTLDYCRLNSDPSASPNITLTAESAYNIFDSALQDFAG